MSPAVGDSEVAAGEPVPQGAVSPRLPLLNEEAPPRQPGLISRAALAIWNSCTACALVASLCLASAAAAIKVLADEVSVFQITAVRAILTFPLFAALAYYQGGTIIGPRDNLMLIELRGICATMAFLMGTFATLLLPLSEASLYINCYPVVLSVMVWMLGMESVDYLSWIGIFGTLFSQVLIAQPPFLFGGETQAWDLSRYLGILSAVVSVTCKSTGFVIVRKIDKSVPSILITTHSALQLLCISVPFVPTGYPKKLNLSPSWMDALLYLIGAFSALAQLLMVRAIKIGPPIKATMVSLTRVVMMMALGVVVCSEEITFLHGLGAALTLLFIALVAWRKNEMKKQKTLAVTENPAPYESLPQPPSRV